jgi:hypothetical protein
VESWGAALYGDPYRECGFDWSLSPEEATCVVADIPARYAAILAGSDGRQRHPDLAWTAGAYVCHVTDNLRNWAERLAGAALGGSPEVVGYDPDLLAKVRGYAQVPLPGALWSLRHAALAWLEAVELGRRAGTVLLHATRGKQQVEDVASNNAHDAHHHGWDISRSLV